MVAFQRANLVLVSLRTVADNGPVPPVAHGLPYGAMESSFIGTSSFTLFVVTCHLCITKIVLGINPEVVSRSVLQ